jgi:hypothetical protein
LQVLQSTAAKLIEQPFILAVAREAHCFVGQRSPFETLNLDDIGLNYDTVDERLLPRSLTFDQGKLKRGISLSKEKQR